MKGPNALNWILASSLSLLVCLTGSSQAEPAKARLGRQAWIAFECATYARLSGQSNEETRLSDLGVESSRAFVDAYFSNQITEQEASTEIPFGVMDVLFGSPSNDKNFIAGRLFESATSYARDRVMKRRFRPFNEWIADPSLTKSIAEDRFRTANCALVR